MAISKGKWILEHFKSSIDLEKQCSTGRYRKKCLGFILPVNLQHLKCKRFAERVKSKIKSTSALTSVFFYGPKQLNAWYAYLKLKHYRIQVNYYPIFNLVLFFNVATTTATIQLTITKSDMNKMNWNEDPFPVGTLKSTELYSNKGIKNHSHVDVVEQSQDAWNGQNSWKLFFLQKQ